MEEANTNQPLDIAGEFLLHNGSRTLVYLADAKAEERSALRLLLFDLKMEVIGEAADWPNTLTQAPATPMDMILVDWDLLPADLGFQALAELRRACTNAIIVVLISHLDAHQQVVISAGADAFISKGETPKRVAERLRPVATSILSHPWNGEVA